jgi:hypothetical protein
LYCDQEILMDINGNSKWAAFNINGGYHVCTKKKQEPQVIINETKPGPLTLEELDARVKRLEAFMKGPQK